MISLRHKPVSNRKTRPRWVSDERQLMEKTMGADAMRRYQIARLYWRENKSSREVAKELGVSVDAVKSVLKRLSQS